MTGRGRGAFRSILALVVLLLSACDAGPGETRLNLFLADAPVDEAAAVLLKVHGVELELADGETRLFTFNPPRMIDVLAAQGGRTVPLLENQPVPDGRYSALRLLIAADPSDDSQVRLHDGSQHSLVMLPEARDALRLVTAFQVPARMTSSYILDIDLRRSVYPPRRPGGGYELRPVLRLINGAEAGAITGRVGASLLRSGCRPAVYVYRGEDQNLDDMGGAKAQPLASTLVAPGDGGYVYTIAFLPAGEYRAAFTCEAERDHPGADDDLTFIPPRGSSATVSPGSTTELNLGQDRSPDHHCPRRKPAHKPGQKPDKPPRDRKPGNHDKPRKPDKPDKPENPAGADKPDKPDKPPEPDRPKDPDSDDDTNDGDEPDPPDEEGDDAEHC